nr:sterol desaturase family protein [Bacteroidota bacterium]
FLLLLYLQFRHPLRRWVQGLRPRILINTGLAVASILVLRLVLIPAEVLSAVWAEREGFGLLNLIGIPGWLRHVIGFLFMDYMLYAWHWMNHKIPLLWRFHNVHHTDLDLGVTTAFRFHFFEMFLGTLIRAGGILVVGVPMEMVLVYEVVFQVMVAFQHSNWRLPYRLERSLVLLMITPRMHGIHHSIVERETNSNYTNVFSFWDRLHGTIRLNVPQDEVTIGVPAYQDQQDAALSLTGLYLLPFKKQRGDWVLKDGTKPDREYEGNIGELQE